MLRLRFYRHSLFNREYILTRLPIDTMVLRCGGTRSGVTVKPGAEAVISSTCPFESFFISRKLHDGAGALSPVQLSRSEGESDNSTEACFPLSKRCPYTRR
jgi:hypothetical protein